MVGSDYIHSERNWQWVVVAHHLSLGIRKHFVFVVVVRIGLVWLLQNYLNVRKIEKERKCMKLWLCPLIVTTSYVAPFSFSLSVYCMWIPHCFFYSVLAKYVHCFVIVCTKRLYTKTCFWSEWVEFCIRNYYNTNWIRTFCRSKNLDI